jgi:hypothetical protein
VPSRNSSAKAQVPTASKVHRFGGPNSRNYQGRSGILSAVEIEMRGDECQFLSDQLAADPRVAARRMILAGTRRWLFAGLAALSIMLGVATPGWAQGTAVPSGTAPTQGAVSGAGGTSPDNQIPPAATEPTAPDGAEPLPNAQTVPAEPSAQPADPGQFTDDAARDAVNSGQAVGLGSLLPDIRQRTSGTVIDAGMQNRNGTLIYSIRVLRPDGRVTTELYDATTGSHVGSSP